MDDFTFPMRINKYLALKKHSTRRGADELIKKGQVFINNKLAVLGDKVNKDDVVDIKFRGKPQPMLYFAYNKPRGVITHSASKGEKEIRDIVPIKGVFPVGRLDKDSHGLMILTNDGRITDRLLNPLHDHTKEYLVKTKNKLTKNFKEDMEGGLKIEKERTKPCKVEILSDRLFKIILTEGKKHQIRRMCSALSLEVDDLKRIKVMNIELGKLGAGKYREITGEELNTFLYSLDLV